MIEVWIAPSDPHCLHCHATPGCNALRFGNECFEEGGRVMHRLAELGALESRRTQQVRNAIAVTLPATTIESVKKIDGVIAVRPATIAIASAVSIFSVDDSMT